MSDTQRYDWRLDELRRLGELERRLAAEILEARDAVAQVVKQLLPHHAAEARINEVVEATELERLRSVDHYRRVGVMLVDGWVMPGW